MNTKEDEIATFAERNSHYRLCQKRTGSIFENILSNLDKLMFFTTLSSFSLYWFGSRQAFEIVF